MTKHEIHLSFMEVTLSGIFATPNPGSSTVEEAIKDSILIADLALKTYLTRWPDVKFED